MDLFKLSEPFEEEGEYHKEFADMMECVLRDVIPVNVYCVERTFSKVVFKVGKLTFVFMFTGRNQLRVCVKPNNSLVGFLNLKGIDSWRESECKILHVIAEVINFNFGTKLTRKKQGISLTFE